MIRRIRKQLNKKGFTLVELIAVLAILAIVAAIAIPTFNTTIENSKIKADLATAANIGRVAELFVVENTVTYTDGIITLTANDDFLEYFTGSILPTSRQTNNNTSWTVTVRESDKTATVILTVDSNDVPYWENGVGTPFSKDINE